MQELLREKKNDKCVNVDIITTKAIKQLESQVAEDRKKIRLLQQFVNISENGIDEKSYHLFCQTPLKYEDCLGLLLSATMPFLQYDHKDCNYFYFTTDDNLLIKIPIFDANCAYIVLQESYLRKYKLSEYNYDIKKKKQIQDKIDNINNFIASDDFCERAKMLFPGYKKYFQVIIYAISGIIIDYDDKVIKQLNEAKHKMFEYGKENTQRYKEYCRLQQEQQQTIDKYKSLLLRWTKQIIVLDDNNNEV